jgi:gamma-glutamylcyclotransferase (GGCT)/AIG2-like uncharacterized protein YtfP
MALMFLNGGGMRGGPVHQHIDGVPLIGERRTAPRYRFYSIRDEYPGLSPVGEQCDGQPILGELYDVPMALLRSLLASEPPELELSIVELAGGQLSFGMILRSEEHGRGRHKDITHYGGWRAYRSTLGRPETVNLITPVPPLFP